MSPPKSVIIRNKQQYEKLLKLREEYNSSTSKDILKPKPKKKKPKHKKKKRRPPGLQDRVVKHWKSYQDYCKSDAFKIWKKAILKKYKRKCQLCGGKAQTAHHTNYRTWGTERLEDGIAVCNKCHKSYHYHEPWWNKQTG